MKVKERKRWSVNVRAADEITGEAYNLLGPHGESSWFYASDGWDREEVELVVKRRNARLDAKERTGPFEARPFGGEAWIVVDTRSGNRVATHLPDYSQMEAAAKRDAAERNARLDAEEGERWRVSDLHGHCALGPQDQVVWFHMTGGAKRDPEACAAFVARENARLDKEEGRK